jgi:hypothetical protein
MICAHASPCCASQVSSAGRRLAVSCGLIWLYYAKRSAALCSRELAWFRARMGAPCASAVTCSGGR